MQTIIVVSEYYGPVSWQYLGTVDIRKSPDLRVDPWFGKHHPAKVFHGAYWGIPVDHVLIGDRETCVSWDVWVPTTSANKGTSSWLQICQPLSQVQRLSDRLQRQSCHSLACCLSTSSRRLSRPGSSTCPE